MARGITRDQTLITARRLASFLAAALVFLGARETVVLAQEANVQLEVGEAAPRFEGVDEAGKPWRLEDHLGKGAVVLCFYPGDFGAGCAKRSQLFRESLNRLAERGACVVAVSGDMPATHAMFKAMHDLRFTLLADERGELARQFGVPVADGSQVRVTDPAAQSVLDANRRFLIVRRPATLAPATFIIGRDGRVVYKSTPAAPYDQDAWAQFVENEPPR